MTMSDSHWARSVPVLGGGTVGISLWLFNIAMEHGPFIDDFPYFPIKTSIFFFDFPENLDDPMIGRPMEHASLRHACEKLATRGQSSGSENGTKLLGSGVHFSIFSLWLFCYLHYCWVTPGFCRSLPISRCDKKLMQVAHPIASP